MTMTAPNEPVATPATSGEYQRIAGVLGGARVLHRQVRTPLDAHELISAGLPGASLKHMVAHVSILHDATMLQKAIGISVRTLQRRKEEPDKALSPEQGGRTWKFAEVLNKATELLGSQQEAEHWLVTPAVALEQRSPIDLMSTPAGVELVENLLQQLEYGVYV